MAALKILVENEKYLWKNSNVIMKILLKSRPILITNLLFPKLL